jgi:hypothetical protein
MKNDIDLIYIKCNLSNRYLKRLHKIEIYKMNKNFQQINNLFLECLFDDNYYNNYINIFNHYNDLWIYYSKKFNKNNFYKTININEYWFFYNYRPLENLYEKRY